MMIKIIDIIHHSNKDYTQEFLVLNRMPNFLYKRKGNWLEAEDCGFFNFYHYQESRHAFAGREFDIPLANGEIIKAYGQWWDGLPGDYYGLVVPTAIGTIEKLGQCNVFSGAHVDPLIIATWLKLNSPSNNYHKYDPRDKVFMKQTIVSQWKPSNLLDGCIVVPRTLEQKSMPGKM
jgi:hypothetical protein